MKGRPVAVVVYATEIVCLSPYIACSNPRPVKTIDPETVSIHITVFIDVVAFRVFCVIPASVTPDIALTVPLSPITFMDLAVGAETRRLPDKGIKSLWLRHIHPTGIHELFIHIKGFHPKLAIFVDISPEAFHDLPIGKLIRLNPDVILSRGDNVRRYVCGTQ